MENQKPLVKNAGDPRQVKEGKKKEKWLREGELDDVRWVLSERRGRRFIWRLLKKARVKEQRFDGDINWALFWDGRASLGLLIEDEIVTADPDKYILMMQEARKESEHGN